MNCLIHFGEKNAPDSLRTERSLSWWVWWADGAGKESRSVVMR